MAADLADHHVVLDGEVVALDESGVPSFGEMQNWEPDPRGSSSGPSTCCGWTAAPCCAPSTPTGESCWRRCAAGGGLIVPEPLPGDGPEAAGLMPVSTGSKG